MPKLPIINCLSLWQPWASLCAVSAKQIETRSWPTGYRGWLAIHAAKKCDGEVRSYLREDLVLQHLLPHYLPNLVITPMVQASLLFEPPTQQVDEPDEDRVEFFANELERALPFGQIVSIHWLDDCHSVTRNLHLVPKPDTPEHFFGYYATTEGDRFMWMLERTKRLPTPIPLKGMQGLWGLLPGEPAYDQLVQQMQTLGLL